MAVRLLRRRQRHPRPRRVLRRRVAPRPAGFPLLDGAIADAGVRGRRAVRGRRPPPVRRRVEALVAGRARRAALLYHRRRYLRIERATTAQVIGKPESPEADAPHDDAERRPPTGSRSATSSRAPGRPRSCSTGRPRRARGLRRPAAAVPHGVPRATSPTPAATPRPAGTPPTASATTGSIDDLDAFADALASPRSTSSGSRWAARRARVRGPPPGAAADARRRRDHAAPRAAGVGRPAADGPRPDPAPRPSLGGRALGARTTRVQGPGAWQRLLPAIAATSPSSGCSSPPTSSDRRPDAGRRRRPRPVRPGRPRLGPQAPAARRATVRRPRLRPRGERPEAGAVQRGAGRVLPVHEDGRRGAGAGPSRRDAAAASRARGSRTSARSEAAGRSRPDVTGCAARLARAERRRASGLRPARSPPATSSGSAGRRRSR